MAWVLLAAAAVLFLTAIILRQRVEAVFGIAVALILVVAGSSVSLLTRAAERTRIDAHYLGARIPAAAVRDCAVPATARDRDGIWIGAGPRWDGDTAADAVHVPGYRGHLVEICKASGTLDEVRLRTVDGGMTFDDAGKLVPSTDLETQRVIMGPRGNEETVIGPVFGKSGSCLSTATKSVTVDAILANITTNWDRARHARRYSGRREQFLSTHAPFPPEGHAFCVDVRGTSPAPCTKFDAAASVFVWRRGLEWHGLPPAGGAWCDCKVATPPAELAVKPAVWIAGHPFPANTPSIALRMIIHRTAGTLADASVQVPAGSYSPAGFRVGAQRVVRFARLGNDLLVMPEEPSVQLRIDDLYGRQVRGLPPGKLQLVFDESEARLPLVLNLGAVVDHLPPKPMFAAVAADLTIPQSGDQYIVVGNDGTPKSAGFGEVVDLPSSRPDDIRPLIVLSRIDVPFGTNALPVAAAVLFIVALIGSWFRGGATARWTLAAVLLVLLDIRFFLSVRGAANAPWSNEMTRSWVVCGFYLLVLPPLLMVLARARRWRKSRSGRLRVAVEIYWFIAALFCAIAWVYGAGSGWKAVVRQLRNEFGAMTIAVALSLGALFLAGRSKGFFGRLYHGLQSIIVRAACWAGRFFRKRLVTPDSDESPIGVALVFGVFLVLLRLGMMSLGLQESIFGARADVFFIPIGAAVAAAITRMTPREAGDFRRLVGLAIFLLLAFPVVGGITNDFGLAWVGAMATVLVLPLIAWRRVKLATWLSAGVLIVAFLLPRLFPAKFAAALWRTREEPTAIGPNNDVTFPDVLLVNQDRDYYRMLHAVYPKGVEEIPSQIARQVVVDHERVRYQSLNGAWRESFRADERPRSPITGAGLLRAKPIVGEPSFTDASRSDYVYPLYVRAEFGTIGIVALIVLYGAMFLAPPHGVIGDRVDAPVAIWSLGLAAGTALFMLGGTASVFPFSGKWCLFMAFASGSDIALGASLFALAMIAKEEW